MDFEFDKEIDALLRQTAQGGVFVPTQPAPHLDADEISAFAENALPEKIRQRYTLHLADCDKCRKNLSNLIALDSETETVRAEEEHFIAARLPWYRKLFAFPNLAYTLGALVLVFSGIAAFTVLRNVKNPESAEVSQVSERQPSGKGMNSDGDASTTESYSSNTMSNANMMMSNSASMNSSSSASANFSNPSLPSAPTAAMNSNAAMRMREEDSDKNLRAESKSLAPKESADLAKTQDSIAAGARPPAAKENDYQFDAETQRQQPNQTQNSVAQNQTQITPDSRNVQQRAPMPTALSANERSKKAQDSKDDKQEKTNEAISVGGKIFKRENNVWYDSAYRGQATINITRGTNEYKKLDAGLRGIAENLGGTIVVVWKQKAYRIQ
jgi:hypothetical protein